MLLTFRCLYLCAFTQSQLLIRIGNNNIGVGYATLDQQTDGNTNDNCIVGSEAHTDIVYGIANTSLGSKSLVGIKRGSYNTMIGYRDGDLNYVIVESNWNTGFGTTFTQGGEYGSCSMIGWGASLGGGVNHKIRFGNNLLTAGGYANWTNVSDGRFKINVTENVVGLDFIMKLRPVTYNLDMDALAQLNNTPDSLRTPRSEKRIEKVVQSGFIAQEVEVAANQVNYDFHGISKPTNENDNYGLRYSEFVVPLVKTIQDQQEIIANQNTEIESQEMILEDLINSLEALENK